MTIAIAILFLLLAGLLLYAYLGGPTLPPETEEIIEDVLNSQLPEIIVGQTGFASSDGLDIQETAELVLYDLRQRRGINLRAAFQHQTAVTISGARYEKLKTVNIPTLVIHGTAEQFIPVEHGHKLAEVIPKAKGLWLNGVGHIFPLPDMATLMKKIIAHLIAANLSHQADLG
jgi:pimeloyl-ACP methyl ester carboxylesterase